MVNYSHEMCRKCVTLKQSVATKKSYCLPVFNLKKLKFFGEHYACSHWKRTSRDITVTVVLARSSRGGGVNVFSLANATVLSGDASVLFFQ